MSNQLSNYHEIYARNLLSDNGFAPYYPCPVDIAEVGYVFGGGWEPLFNASKEPGDESNEQGIPNGYRPLDVGKLKTRILSGGSPITNERGRSLEFGIKGSSAAIPVTSVESQYTFTSSRQEGAILVPGDTIDTADAVERLRYISYIRENSASWLEFANKRHKRGIRLIDLVLVTGWHKTASWACAAFSQCSREITLTFNVGVGTAQGGVWGKWSEILSPGVGSHSGPVRANLKDSQPSPPQGDQYPMNVDNLERKKKRKKNRLCARSEQMEGAYQHCSANVQALGADSTNIRDQGIFIRGYKICDRPTGMARILHRKQCLKYGKDGFTYIHPRAHGESNDDHNGGDEDMDQDSDPSSSRRDPSSRGPGNLSSSPSSSSSGSQAGTMSRSSDGNSGASSSSHRNHLAHDFNLNDDLVLYLQLNGNKEPTAVEIILEHILENSSADFSLAHDDDVTELLQHGFGAEDLAVGIRKISPQIFVVDQVGMLHQTYMASLGNRRDEGHVAQGMPNTTAYDPPFSIFTSDLVLQRTSSDPHFPRIYCASGDKIRRYKCKVCLKEFSRHAGLEYHMQNHMSERPFTCSQCYKRFSIRSNLRRHERTHMASGFKPENGTDGSSSHGFYGNSSTSANLHSHRAR